MRPFNRSSILCLLLFVCLNSTACQKQPAPPLTEVVALKAAAIPEKPDDAAWNSAPEYLAKLILQDLVEPRLMTPSTTEVRVRAIRTEKDIAFRLEWEDATNNDLSDPGKFCDACAIQLPQKLEPTVPAPQMGEAHKGVEITYWNAGWQAMVDGRGDAITDIYPNATVDHYPFDAKSLEMGSPEQQEMAKRYAPAKAMGNLMAGPQKSPVQDLLAEGPGSLSPASSNESKGCGKRTPKGWAVVISRRLPDGIAADVIPQIAFAVWDGAKQEVGAKKMRTAWINLNMKDKQQ
jgi:DMSO reductase family type II enzyme heme b subunit